MGPRPPSRGNRSKRMIPVWSVSALQWGHGLPAVETDECLRRIAPVAAPSMGPRPPSRGNTGNLVAGISYKVHLQWGHGLPAVETRKYSGRSSTPARFLQWGHGLPAVETGLSLRVPIGNIVPSMGPRPPSRGNAPRSNSSSRQTASLQWGHGLPAVETGHPLTRVDVRRMHLQWGHGLPAVETVGESHLLGAQAAHPSMGPRPPSRGNPDVTPLMEAMVHLQWGHGLPAVETCSPTGHNGRPTPFNGATASQPWKLVQHLDP